VYIQYTHAARLLLVVTVGSDVCRRMRGACVAIGLSLRLGLLQKWIQRLVTTHARTTRCMLTIVYILVVVTMSPAFTAVRNTVYDLLVS